MEQGGALWTQDDGYMQKHKDKVWTAAEKLEQLISQTLAVRGHHCDHPADDIVEEDKLKVILDSWKNDYKRWMRPETLAQALAPTRHKWQQTLRKAFRSHLFQLVGSFEMVVFFLVAPFSSDHLQVFRHYTNHVAGEQVPHEERNGLILELSKNFVRLSNNK